MNRSMAERTDAVRTEVRKMTNSKPVHAAAGAGVVASAAVRELPARFAHWRAETEASLTALPRRASEYVTTARTRVAHRYDQLAAHGERVMNSAPVTPAVPAVTAVPTVTDADAPVVAEPPAADTPPAADAPVAADASAEPGTSAATGERTPAPEQS